MIRPGKIIIVGGNAAGPAAAAKAKRVSPDSHVMMFEAGSFISTGTCEIPYTFSGEVKNYEDIIYYTPESFKAEKGVDVFINHFVEDINRREKYILVRNLVNQQTQKYSYDKMILACGSIPKSIPGIDSNFVNVFNLKTLKDVITINDFLRTVEVHNVTVIGAGYLGLETADGFKKLGFEVFLVDKEKVPMPTAEVEISHLILELLKSYGVLFYHVEDKLQVIADANSKRITSLNIDGRIIETDLIIVTAGFVPNNSLALKAKLEVGKSGALKVDSKLKTSDPNIYAAGDNIEVSNFVTGQKDYFPLAAIAHESGHIAGENAAGGNIMFGSVVKNIAVKILDKFYVSVGITSGEAKKHGFIFDSAFAVTDSLVKVMPESNKVFGKIIWEKNTKRILGGSFFGDKHVAGFADIISTIIRAKQPGSILRDINYNYTPPLSPFVNLMSILGRKIK
jgi:NADPH-dependent 2,4-dienoyl-CoA reductase/sulfur reductase-like enzyme